MNTLLASILNSILPALALLAALEILLRLKPRWSAARRFTVLWLALPVLLLLLPLANRPERRFSAELPEPSAPVIVKAAAEPQVQDAAPAVPAPRRGVTVQRISPLVPIWLAVMLVILGRLARAWLWLRRTRRNATRLAHLTPRMDNLLLRYGVPRYVRLLESDRILSPIAAGFRQPAIILPKGLAARLTPEELDDVLLHETAHLARRDDWWNLFALAVRAVLWFHPAVLWILHRLEQEREMACDEWAVRASGQRKRYAASLARLLELRLEQRAPLLATGAFGARPGISRRIESLLSGATRVRHRISWPKLAASFAAVALLIVISTHSPELIAAVPEEESFQEDVDLRQPPASPDAPTPPQPPAAGPKGFLAGIAAAGYDSLSVDDLIELKNNGVDGAYMAAMNAAGLVKLSARQLIELHSRGVSAAYVRTLTASGLPRLAMRDILELAENGVNASAIAEIHSLGFGPYSARQHVELHRRGVSAKYFRELSEAGISGLDPRDIVEGVSRGVCARDIREARRYHPDIKMTQIIRLKEAGAI